MVQQPPSMALHFTYHWSTVIQKHSLDNSRNKQFNKQSISFKSRQSEWHGEMSHHPLHPAQDIDHPFVELSTKCTLSAHWSPSSHPSDQVDLRGVSVLVFMSPLFYSITVPEHKGSDADNQHVPRRSQKALLLNEKIKVLDLIRKERIHMLRLLRSMVRTDLSVNCEKGKRICASFLVAPQTAEVTATVGDNRLVSMEKALICGWET